MRKIKLLFILDHFYPHIGGAETLFWNLCNELSKNNFLKITIATSNSGGINGYRKIKKNFEVFYFKWPIFFGHPIPKYHDLKELIQESDIIHTSTYTSAFFSFFYAKINRKKIIVTVYENLFLNWFKVESFFKAIIFFIFEFITVRLPFNYYIAISEATKKDLEKVFINKNKIIVVYPFLKNFISNKVLFKKHKKNNEKYFLYYGRPGKTKGIFILFEAIKKLKSNPFIKGFKFKFILSSDPIKEKQKFIKLVYQNRLENIIKIFNSQSKIKLFEYISKSYAVIVPSITEGFGYTTYETILQKKPVIASDVEAIKEIIGGKYLIFKNGDSLDLSNKIILAIKNKFLKKRIIVINPENECFKLINVYKKVLNLDIINSLDP